MATAAPVTTGKQSVRVTLWILLIVYIFNFIDRQIVNILAEPIRMELGLSDTQIGLMTGLARRTGWSLRLVRTGIEVSVIALGWLLGGVVGVGTVLYAIAIGPLTQALLPWFTVELDPRRVSARAAR